MSSVAILGGYGDLGQHLARSVLHQTDMDVVIIGRDRAAASRAAQSLGPRARPVAADVTSRQIVETIDGVTYAVNLVEALPAELAGRISASGPIFVETSAEPDFVADVRRAIEAHQGRGVTNVGLAPGLSEILAIDLLRRHPACRHVVMNLEMGMGHRHGKAAIVWALRNIDRTFPVLRNSQWIDGQTADRTRDIDDDGARATRLAISFGFVDQVAVGEALDGEGTVETYLSLDPAWLTRAMSKLAGTATGRLVARHSSALARLAPFVPAIGSSQTRLVVQALGPGGQPVDEWRVRSADQASVTASMIVCMLDAAEASNCGGLRRMHDLVDASRAREWLSDEFPDTQFGLGNRG